MKFRQKILAKEKGKNSSFAFLWTKKFKRFSLYFKDLSNVQAYKSWIRCARWINLMHGPYKSLQDFIIKVADCFNILRQGIA